jgi:hypothetical protein
LYVIFTEFGIPMKLVMLIRICLKKTYSKVRMNECLMHFLSRVAVNKENDLSPILFSFA